MSELPTPISDQDKLLSNIAIGTPSIDDLIPNSRQEVYLKYIATKGMNGNLELPIPIANGGTGATTETGVRENLEVYKEYVLYENTSGTTGTITLSDSYKNFKKIVVCYKDSDQSCYNTATLYTDSGAKLALSINYLYTSGTGYYVHSTAIYFSGNTVSFSRNGMVVHNEEPTIDVTLSSDTGIYVNKIIGFKY